jgi:hypothetical protein
MIKYKKTITLQRKRNGTLQIVSDKGDIYETTETTEGRTMVTDWWANQHQNELREWQKDLVVKYAGDAFGKGSLYSIYKKGKGYKQPHDMCLFYSEEFNCWVFATQDDYWIQFSDSGEIIFDKSDSIGNVLNKEDRLLIGNIWDQLKKEYNPENYTGWVRI